MEENPSIDDIKAIHKKFINPLYKIMKENKEDISSRLDFRNDFAFSCNAIPDYSKNVVNVFANPSMIKGLTKCKE